MQKDLNGEITTQDPKDIRIAELEAALAAALARIAELEAQIASLLRNSRNSSKPPSTDPPGVDRPKKNAKKRKRGGQHGHKASFRELLPVEQVDRLVTVIPESCERCGGELKQKDPAPRRHQVVDIPPVTPTVVEYQLHRLCCRRCGYITRANLPEGIPANAFGPRLSAMVAVLTSKYRLSKRAVREFVGDFLGVELALGSVVNIEQQVSAALAEPDAAAREYVRKAAAVNADETGWRENKRKAWLWLAATPLVSVFLVATSRGSAVAKELLGENFKGLLTTDRFTAYQWVDVLRRQICWAHLIRDFQSWVDDGGIGAEIGRAILKEKRRIFRWWHRVRDGTMTREQFAKKMRPVQINVGTWLTVAETCPSARIRGMAKKMLQVETAFWTFINEPDLEPTNNYAERQIRHAVLWRKGCFGTDSAAGSRFVERMLTTITSLRQQRRNVLEFITDACVAQLNGTTPPSLIPEIQESKRLAA